MSREKLRVHRTDLTNLIGNLRGEVGEIITSWTLLRTFKVRRKELASCDVAKDMRDPQIIAVEILCSKLEDEIVARLSELAESKIGRLTFHFAAVKLGEFEPEVKAFQTFIRSKGFEEKRNLDISHKELPETFSDHRHRHIPYRTLIRGVARAVRLMKRIDRSVLGPSAPYLWREVRQKRYTPMAPPSAGYLILPYYRLPDPARLKVIQAEIDEGRSVLSEMDTLLNGKPTRVLVAKEWGAVVIGSSLILLKAYPLQQLQNIDLTNADA